ncbi:hypothetical protein [Thalassoroseus pseudoceratinae]|uniref:hypothetical protein n=1 Tax=Thalassoroseus pseudoceratinae TaxID=2713176 RepID=UPI00141E9CEE|nr:hypothetical protein [Thalassoroseus pseudoceratinae]
MTQTETTALRPIEIGLIIAEELDQPTTQALQQFRLSLQESLSTSFPDFEWEFQTVWRRELTSTNTRAEPVVLLDIAREERDARDWDFVFVVTPADLVSHYKPFAYGIVSRSMDSAVLSTARLDPRTEDHSVDSSVRVRCLAGRLKTLARQAFGQINSLDCERESDTIMNRIQTLVDLDSLDDADWSDQQREVLKDNLSLIADLRLEEVPEQGRIHPISFYIQSSWLNRHEIADAVIGARPWEFPVRLNRLTTAALSSSLILIVTAEAWELSVVQPIALSVFLAIATILVTAGYVTVRQQLLVRREQRMSEQSVITNVTSVSVVLIGMLAMYAATFALLTAVTCLLFQPELIKRWTGLDDITWQVYAIVSVIVASFSVIVGALGASFEEHRYFRHIIFVDEEI